MSIFFKINNVKTIKCLINPSIRCCTTTATTTTENTEFLQYGNDKDPGIAFIKPETQKLLNSMTRIDLEKIFRKRTVPENTVKYKFMTTEEINSEITNAAITAKKYLQMPPIVKERKEEHVILSNDPGMRNFTRAKFVFTDITYGLKDNDRTIIVRHRDGILEKAQDDVRKRMIQLYFPKIGRTIRTPRMFELDNFRKCLDEFKYEFILDRLCIQYEPYEKDYHSFTSQVYQHINESKKFHDLRSTRHFGPMVFFYAWHKIIDDLLLDMIKRDFLNNAIELICLAYNLNAIEYDPMPLAELNRLQSKDTKDTVEVHIEKTLNKTEIDSVVGKTENDFKSDDLACEFIELYIKSNAIKKVQLDIAIQNYKQFNEERKQLYYGLRKAHGVN